MTLTIKSTDEVRGEIKVLYDLGEGGQYEIIQRSIFILSTSLNLGMNSKSLVDRMMDLGVKPLELGIALSVSMRDTDPILLSKIDQKIREKIMSTSKEMFADWDKMVKLNEP